MLYTNKHRNILELVFNILLIIHEYHSRTTGMCVIVLHTFNVTVGQLSAFIQAHTNHMASPATTGSSRKRKSYVLFIEDKL